MMKCKWMIMLSALWVGAPVFAMMSNAQMSVWVNEAIVATYTYNATDLIPQQKEIAHYFTAAGWIAYSQAFNKSNLSEAVKKNKYAVSAVATLPPAIKKIGANQWTAVMPLLVLYQNPNYKQTQTLEVVLGFTEAPSGQGVRGLAITSLQAKKSSPPCPCILSQAQVTDVNAKKGHFSN